MELRLAMMGITLMVTAVMQDVLLKLMEAVLDLVLKFVIYAAIIKEKVLKLAMMELI